MIKLKTKRKKKLSLISTPAKQQENSLIGVNIQL